MKHRATIRLALVAAILLAAGLAPLPRRETQIRIGSKKFTESVVLGECLRLLLESEEVQAVHYREFGGTRIVFDALAAGDIDVYPDYTGTIRQEILSREQLPDDAALREALNRRGIGLSDSLGFNNTYALALGRRRAEELGIAKISDLRRLPELRLALTHEFLDRGDGWRALAKRYELPQRNVPGVDHDVAYRQLLAGEIDVIDVYSTDAMIARGDLMLLKDDLEFFPAYEAVWLYRLKTAERLPALAASIEKLTGQIDESMMQSLNEQVEAGESETQVAARFLRERLGISIRAPRESWARLIARHVGEHLDLVRRSLLPAIVAGVALGVFCQRRPRAGSVILTGVGLLQTIPSLALLVLLLPILGALGYRTIGEGSLTAVVALFCYCLLPIVRNTYTGLAGIPTSLRESAVVLGLSPLARLTEIELPIARPTILAGIRTAAVQNVGFATLGAIIGAGGLGQPILRGIRLNDASYILAGAIPAALLALAIQVAIDLLERFTTPRGMKTVAHAQE